MRARTGVGRRAVFCALLSLQPKFFVSLPVIFCVLLHCAAGFCVGLSVCCRPPSASLLFIIYCSTVNSHVAVIFSVTIACLCSGLLFECTWIYFWGVLCCCIACFLALFLLLLCASCLIAAVLLCVASPATPYTPVRSWWG